MHLLEEFEKKILAAFFYSPVGCRISSIGRLELGAKESGIKRLCSCSATADAKVGCQSSKSYRCFWPRVERKVCWFALTSTSSAEPPMPLEKRTVHLADRVWSNFNVDPRVDKLFNTAMSSHLRIYMEAMLGAYQGFQDVNCLVDVGECTGASLC